MSMPLKAAIELGPRMADTEARRALALKRLQVLQAELADVRQETRNLVIMQMRPGQSAERVKFLHDLERSCRAETKLRVLALAHFKHVSKLEGGSTD